VICRPSAEIVNVLCETEGRWISRLLDFVIVTSPCFVRWVRGGIPEVVKAYLVANVLISADEDRFSGGRSRGYPSFGCSLFRIGGGSLVRSCACSVFLLRFDRSERRPC